MARQLNRRTATGLLGAALTACTRPGVAADAPRETPRETAVPADLSPALTPTPEPPPTPTSAPVAEPAPQPAPQPPALRIPIYYSAEYVIAGHSYETTRKARWVAESLQRDPVRGMELEAPAPLSEAQVAAVHDPVYVQAVRSGQPRTLAESQSFRWDPMLFPSVLASNGGAVAAALAAWRSSQAAAEAGQAAGLAVAGSLSSGLHHAHRQYGLGNCTFNGLALAARALLAAGAKNVLILDLDAHCGGGTNELVGQDPRVWHVDVAVHTFDRYQPAPRQTLDVVQAAAAYLPTVQRRLEDLRSRAPAFDVCLYNAGMDPFEGCPVGGLRGVTREVLEARERLVFEWARRQSLPVAFVLAGGYLGPALNQEGLAGLHRLTLQAAAA